MTANDRIRAILRELNEHRPTGIISDIDGTISPIAASPGAARVDERARQALAALTNQADLVAVVSGRSVSDAREMVALDEIVYAGNHGMEWWINSVFEESELARELTPRIERVLKRLEREISIDGVLVENKGLTGSIHVRETENPDTAEQDVLRHVERLCQDEELRISRGRMVIEIRPSVELNKGTAVLDLVERFQLRSGIFIGDDVTDVDAFNAFARLRRDRGHHLYSVGVSGPETPDVVFQQADLLVDGVNGVIELLELAMSHLRGAAS